MGKLGFIRFAAAAALLGTALPLAAQVHPNTIYGDDDRIDLYDVKNPFVRKLADSTVALFNSGSISSDAGTGVAKIATSVYGESMGLCKEERFWDQPIGAFCSGSLVAPDIIMTAGHCVTSQDNCAGVKFVFGFDVVKAGEYPSSVPAGNVYGCKELLGRQQEGKGADWALVRLDRKVEGREPLKLDRAAAVANGDPVFVIGHPAGLPTKVAGGAKVRDASPNGYFVANLDTYGGNSGSAVFNGATGLVEGILVRGEQDYVYKDNCRVSNVCPADGCRGEDVTKLSALETNIPPSGVAEAFHKPQLAFASLMKEARVAKLPEVDLPQAP